MSRKKLTKTFEPLNPWQKQSLEAVASYLGHRDTKKLQLAITQARQGEPITSNDDKVQKLAKAPWQPQARSFVIDGAEFYRAIDLDPEKTAWLAHFEKPAEPSKEEELAKLNIEWGDLLRKDYGRTNIARMRAVHERRKALLGHPPVSGIFKGELFKFITTMSSSDPRQRFPCAILPNGYPAAIEIALDYCDQDFEIEHLTLIEFAERLLVASTTEVFALDKAEKDQEYQEIMKVTEPSNISNEGLRV